jgi:hypothetical protein
VYEVPRLRVVRRQGEVLVTVCDAKLIGKEFRQGKLKLKINEKFYGGEEASIEKCLAALEEATIANLVGSIVDHAVKAGFINRANVIRIQKVPHAQMVRL